MSGLRLLIESSETRRESRNIDRSGKPLPSMAHLLIESSETRRENRYIDYSRKPLSMARLLIGSSRRGESVETSTAARSRFRRWRVCSSRARRRGENVNIDRSEKPLTSMARRLVELQDAAKALKHRPQQKAASVDG
jgi:hypothetical protein